MFAFAVIHPSTSLGVWNQSGFVVGGYGAGGDPASLIRLNAAGVEYVIPFDNPRPALARRLASRLDSLRRAQPATFRLKQFVYEEWDAPFSLFKNPDPVGHRQAIVAELSPTSGLNDSSVAGWIIWDEPPLYYGHKPLAPAEVFRSLLEMTRVIRDSTTGSRTHDKLALVNMLPIQSCEWYQPPRCGGDTLAAYRSYLDQYLAPFNADPLPAPVLSFDKYPFESPPADFRLYFAQLAIVRDKAAQYSRPNYRIPFWSVVQAAPRRANAAAPYFPTPTFPQIRWQVYVSLAYGAKGIFYWTLRPEPVPIPEKGPSYGPGFLKQDGSTNGALYDSLTALDAELRALGPTLMRLDPVSVHHTAANRFLLPSGEAGNGVVRLTGAGSEGMAGWFTERATGDAYVMVVNKDTLAVDSYTVDLAQAPARVDRIDKRTGKPVATPLTGASFRTGPILPGSGELFRLARRP